MHDAYLYNLILTQKSIDKEMPFDVLEKVIDDSIKFVKAENINARISNVVLNIDNKLVLAQVYVERKNGFVITQEAKFGASPTSYNVQVRFPNGFEMSLGGRKIQIPAGEFIEPLQPYIEIAEVLDDVSRETDPRRVILGPGVDRQVIKEKREVVFSTTTHTEEPCRLSLPYGKLRDEDKFPECFRVEHYQQELKAFGVYDAFYSDEKKKTTTPNSYVLRINAINGNTFFVFGIGKKERVLPIIRLRYYQLELFEKYLLFVDKIVEGKAPESGLAGIVNMGVGAGKTFTTFTFLQHQKFLLEQNTKNITPPWCFAPDKAIADVTAKTINAQGLSTGMSAATIAGKEQMPDEGFEKLYQTLSQAASDDAKRVDNFLRTQFQSEMLEFCSTTNLHFNRMVNHLGNCFVDSNRKGEKTDQLKNRIAKFKESIDVKRLYLLAESQKQIKDKTGMLGVYALQMLLEKFQKITDGIKEEAQDIFFSDQATPEKIKIPTLDYTKAVTYKTNTYNISSWNEQNFSELLAIPLGTTLRAKRDRLMKIAFLANAEAALLFANSGGLGNTFSQPEIEAQIARLLPIAFGQMNKLIQKENKTSEDQYTLYLYLREVFVAGIPAEIDLKAQLREAKVDVDSWERNELYVRALNSNLGMVGALKNKIQEQVDTLKTVHSLGISLEELVRWGLHPQWSVIEAQHHLAGIASLQITGELNADERQLLITHIPVFTPDGLAAYFEYLASLENKPVVHFKKELDLYHGEIQKVVVTKKDITLRLQQILNALVIADEVHKAEFECLYDLNNAIHQRINAITQRYLGKTFINVLPHRIGMSGTPNDISEKAFGKEVLLHLSTQKMIAQKLVKTISVRTQFHNTIIDVKEYAINIVVNYFLRQDTLEFFRVSKGIVFSRTPDLELNQTLKHYFNLLVNPATSEEDKIIQKELFRLINATRDENFLRPNTLDVNKMKQMQRRAFENNLFALYLEYILSKSNSPKEFSDIIGWQNTCYKNGFHLVELLQYPTDTISEKLISLIKTIDPQALTEDSIKTFAQQRLKGSILSDFIQGLVQYKNNVKEYLVHLKAFSEVVDLPELLTTSREAFESGQSMIMLGGAAERTGYSHEPIGIVLDVLPTHPALVIEQALTKIGQGNPSIEDISAFYKGLVELIAASFTYDEKNQAGGRALRTPHGHATYIEYASALNEYIKFEKPLLQVWRVETSFSDIFTSDEILANKVRKEIAFNRMLFTVLEENPGCDLATFYSQIRNRFVGLEDKETEHNAIAFVWAMKNEPAVVVKYIQNDDIGVFNMKLVQEAATQHKRTSTPTTPSAPGKPSAPSTQTVDPEMPYNAYAKDFDNTFSAVQNQLQGLIDKLKITTDRLQEKANPASAKYNVHYIEVGTQAKVLYDKVSEAFDNYKRNQTGLDIFKNDCKAAFENADVKTAFSKHRGLWQRQSQYFKVFMGVLATLTVLPAMIVAATVRGGYVSTFFKTPATQSTKNVEEFLKSIPGSAP